MSLHDFSQQLQNLLLQKKHIALIAHMSPDGDAYGSLQGLKTLLEENYSHLTVTVVIPHEKQVDTRAHWIIETSVEDIPPGADQVILLDTSLLSRTALTHEVILPILSIDHHEPQETSIPGYYDTEVASTTIILTEIARILNWKISSQAATALLLGIYTDTGGFIHRNSNAQAFSTAAYLLSIGANQSQITSHIFGNYSLGYLHELGHGLLSIVVEDRKACLFFEDEEASQIKSHIIGYLSGLSDVDVACVLYNKGSDVKGSFRTRKDDIDVNLLAQKFGGGGHKKAAGFVLSSAHLDEQTLSWEGNSYTPASFLQFLSSL